MFRVIFGLVAVRTAVLAGLLVVGATSAPLPGHAADCVIGIIDTVAGGGIGDGSPATEASMWRPRSLAIGSDGSIYVGDIDLYRIRRVGPDGIITTVAGNGRFGNTILGVPAVETPVSPRCLAVGPDGNIYFGGGHRIHKIEPTGVVTAVVGDGDSGYSGDGGPALNASLGSPSGLAFAADGSLYIADSGNHRIRRVGPDGIISTVAGNGDLEYSGDGGPAADAGIECPTDLALDAAGNLYILDTRNNCIRKVDRAGIITTVAGTGVEGHTGDGGPAREAALAGPRALAVSADGTIYVAERWAHSVRKIDPAGMISTVAGDGWVGAGEQGRFTGDGGPATKASLSVPQGLAVAADGTLYVADMLNQRIRKVGPAGIITTVAGGSAGDGRQATHANLYTPGAIAVGADGSVYIADTWNHRIRKVDTEGTITTIAGNGGAGYSGDGGPAIEANLYYPSGVAAGAGGATYIADQFNRRVRRVDATGTITTIAGRGPSRPGPEGEYSGDGGPAIHADLAPPSDLAIGANGSIYVADPGNHRVRKVDPTGRIVTVAGNGSEDYSGDGRPATEASFRWPHGVALGADGCLYVADLGNQRIRRIGADGVITTVAGNGERGYSGDGGPATEARLDGPFSVAVAQDETLYIVDHGNGRVRKVSPRGIITTVAGCGWLGGDLGDGGPALEARLHEPSDVAVGPDGALYIVDTRNHRIRRVRWWPCEGEALNALIDEQRAQASESPEAWCNVAKWYLVAQAWDEAVSAAQRLLALTPEGNEPARLRAEVLVARAYVGKRDDHQARRRLIPILARARDPLVLRQAADALIDLYLLRGEREEAIATLNDLRVRTQSPRLLNWIDGRLKEIAGD